MRFLQIKIKEEREIYFEKIEKQTQTYIEPKKGKHFKLYICIINVVLVTYLIRLSGNKYICIHIYV